MLTAVKAGGTNALVHLGATTATSTSDGNLIVWSDGTLAHVSVLQNSAGYLAGGAIPAGATLFDVITLTGYSTAASIATLTAADFAIVA